MAPNDLKFYIIMMSKKQKAKGIANCYSTEKYLKSFVGGYQSILCEQMTQNKLLLQKNEHNVLKFY